MAQTQCRLEHIWYRRPIRRLRPIARAGRNGESERGLGFQYPRCGTNRGRGAAADGHELCHHQPMPNRLPLAARLLFRIHSLLYRATAGVIGHRVGKLRCLLLTTTGARSGVRRTTPLVYGRHGRDIIVVASRGGLPRHPPWYINLVANPAVDVQIGSHHMCLLARPATADERPRLWNLMVAEYPGYEGYQRKTKREIPIVVLESLAEERG